MVNKLIGKKLGMTRYFVEEGRSVPVTVLEVGPCVVVQLKSKEKEGYDAIQVGFDAIPESRMKKPLTGHCKKAGTGGFRHLGEIKVENPAAFELGQTLNTDVFGAGDLVHISGFRKGRGFSGVMRKWGFSGGRKTHGSRSHRVPGSIGCSATPGRITKGKKLPGRMGTQRVTVKNLRVIDVRPEQNLLLVKGAVPGSRNGLIEISKA